MAFQIAIKVKQLTLIGKIEESCCRRSGQRASVPVKDVSVLRAAEQVVGLVVVELDLKGVSHVTGLVSFEFGVARPLMLELIVVKPTRDPQRFSFFSRQHFWQAAN